jgi:uncharacterized protein (TIGR02118 family)
MAAKVLVLYNEPADPAHFQKYYFGTHMPLAKKLPGLRSYTVSRGPIVAMAGAAPCYLVATLEFESMEAMQAALESPEGQATAADVANFATGGVSIFLHETQTV